MKTIEDATFIRSRILKQFELAELAPDEHQRRKHLTFVVVDGGPTGVELAGAIAELSRTILASDFRRIDSTEAGVHLIEAGARLLPSFPEDLLAYATEALSDRNVTVHVNEAVKDIRATSVQTDKGVVITSECVLWAAGVRASPAAEWLPIVEADRAGRLIVNDRLEVQTISSTYAIGDVAHVAGQSIPGIAPAAKQMGRHVAESIAARISDREQKPFQYRHQGDLATIGRRAAVVRIGRLKLKGFPAWLAWCVGHVFFLITARSKVAVSINWIWE